MKREDGDEMREQPIATCLPPRQPDGVGTLANPSSFCTSAEDLSSVSDPSASRDQTQYRCQKTKEIGRALGQRLTSRLPSGQCLLVQRTQPVHSGGQRDSGGYCSRAQAASPSRPRPRQHPQPHPSLKSPSELSHHPGTARTTQGQDPRSPLAYAHNLHGWHLRLF